MWPYGVVHVWPYGVVHVCPYGVGHVWPYGVVRPPAGFMPGFMAGFFKKTHKYRGGGYMRY